MTLYDEVAEAIGRIPLELDRVRSELSTGLAQFHNSQRLTGARYVPVGAGGRTLASAGAGRLVGWSVRAIGGAVSVTLRDARADDGEVLAVLELAAGASQTDWFGPGGISFVEGLRVTATGAGALEGAVWLGAVD